MKPIIAFTGNMGSGKSTAAEALQNTYKWRRMSFAEPLRDMLRCIGLEASDFTPEGKKRKIEWLGKTPRELMQTLGTEWGRKLASDSIWVDLMRRRIEFGFNELGYDGVVIDDCRFDNEAKAIREMGGIVIKISNPSTACVNPSHASESGVSNELIQGYISNVYSREDFQSQVLATVKTLSYLLKK
jgi:cytidylate kinase